MQLLLDVLVEAWKLLGGRCCGVVISRSLEALTRGIDLLIEPKEERKERSRAQDFVYIGDF